MRPLVRHHGIVAPLDRANIDTDQIIPKQFLKRVERTGFGQFLFYDWRTLPNGEPNPEFLLNQAPYDHASILVAGSNFGCGSSREHAPWALEDFGFRVLIAPSFADIFYNNCFQNGILPVTLADSQVRQLIARATEEPGYQLTVDLEAEKIFSDDHTIEWSFTIDPYRRETLLHGLDAIARTLTLEEAIRAYEAAHPL
ncbi:3-isopropylmalate dehydratase small subunit [Sulfobacillus acidophilus TPY]|uniref:3-isopropylmalate dehydratase small subunit n=1 Tax=Sulfobacillus acidophilus (strain ATCC 700253 / DSM 10332 / NAL) TaxID=679936 RepID=G8U091_SULAD|nr:3-isopropylmalate dehydratase small subunit [Sulfobacillus acidophilus TPY]AEW06433.1 3-isopropylmalate dehydratase, small subunit [Sulfobacillus acidophilus DSM 10332]